MARRISCSAILIATPTILSNNNQFSLLQLSRNNLSIKRIVFNSNQMILLTTLASWIDYRRINNCQSEHNLLLIA